MFDFFVSLLRQLVSGSSSQYWAPCCRRHHARCELSMMIEWSATCSLSCLSAMTRQELWLFNRKIWHSEHFNRQKYLVVWSWHKVDSFIGDFQRPRGHYPVVFVASEVGSFKETSGLFPAAFVAINLVILRKSGHCQVCADRIGYF